jgi:hypothetical protein
MLFPNKTPRVIVVNYIVCTMSWMTIGAGRLACWRDDDALLTMNNIAVVASACESVYHLSPMIVDIQILIIK